MTDRLALKLRTKGCYTWVISNKNSSFSKNASKNIALIKKTFGMDYNPFLIIYLIYFIKKNKIDIVVTNIKKEIIAGGIAAGMCRIANLRLVGNERDFDRFHHINQHLVSHNILPCEHVKKIALKNVSWISEKDLSVIHLGRNISTFAKEDILNEKRRLNISPDKLVIGVTGRLAKGKGVDFLIESFSKIAARYPEIVLLITGVGDQQEELENSVTTLNISNRVIFAGFTPHTLLRASLYDIAVMPSEFEAFPYVIVEYFAVGSAVIASEVGGANEIVTDGDNGFLIESNNESELLEKLQLLIENKELREKFRKNSLAASKRKFSEDMMIDRFIDLFKRFI